MSRISQREFYREYHGHKVEHLEILAKRLPGSRGIVYLLGDSTLDNKYWISEQTEAACNGYEDILDVPRSVPDVAYWMNHELIRQGLGDRFCCINGAIEEATLGLHAGGRLLPQDACVRSHLRSKDVVVTSMGGNDVALRPTAAIILSMAALIFSPKWLIKSGLAPGLGYLVRFFKDGTRKYIESLITAGSEPRMVICCMLYYLDTRPGGSWADATLSKLGYDSNPEKLQLILRKVYELGTKEVKVKGITVVPVPLFEALDGADTDDYVQRVEPSSQGGHKLAQLVVARLKQALLELPDSTMPGVGCPDLTASKRDATVAMPRSTHNRT